MKNKAIPPGSVMFSDSLMSADDALSFLIDSSIPSSQTEAVSLDEFCWQDFSQRYSLNNQCARL